MNALVQSTKQNKIAPTSNILGLLVQRKCACGGVSKLGGQCSECEKDKLIDGNGSLIQPKLKIGQPNDKYEQEADRVADQVMAMSSNTNISGTPLRVQRLTGQATGGVDTTVPTSVDRMLASSGRPMNPVLQQDMGQRFGYDFSQIRIHTGSEADRSAQSINARAYTVGQHVVMADGQYAPNSSTGRRLLAHELTHTIQQRQSEQVINNVVQRAGFFQNVKRFFGGGTFELGELKEYIDLLKTSGKIEDDFDSDNKARAVVSQWVNDKSSFLLTTDIKRLLIKEVLSGFTGDDDEKAIISLLQGSSSKEIRDIIDSGKGLFFSDLESDIHGEEYGTYLHELKVKLSGQADVKAIQQTDKGKSACTFEKTLEILDAENTAKKMLDLAVPKINQYVGKIASSNPVVEKTRRVVDCYFRDAAPADLQIISQVIKGMLVNIRNPDYICHGNGNTTYPKAKQICEIAKAGAGVPLTNPKQMFICPIFFGYSRRKQAFSLIHESAHRGGAIPTKAAPEIYDFKCRELTLPKALVNAQSYAFLIERLGS